MQIRVNFKVSMVETSNFKVLNFYVAIERDIPSNFATQQLNSRDLSKFTFKICLSQKPEI